MEEMSETEGSKHYFQINKFTEEINIGDIEGQVEPVPIDGRDYLLQMVVSPVSTTASADKTKYTYTLKRIAGWKLVAVPEDMLRQKIENVDE